MLGGTHAGPVLRRGPFGRVQCYGQGDGTVPQPQAKRRIMPGRKPDRSSHGIALFLYAAFRIFSDLKRCGWPHRWLTPRPRALPELDPDVVRPPAKSQLAPRRVSQAGAIPGHLTLTDC